MQAIDDVELLQASRQGDPAAFGELVERYKSLICAITYSATGSISESEEVAQETFVRAWHKLRLLRDPSRLRPWLCAIARNLARSRYRKERREPTRGAEPLDEGLRLAAEEPSPRERAISREEEAIVWGALEAIPAGYREPLVLYYREEQSVAKVAQLLDLSEDAVKQRLSRGRSMLRDHVAAVVEGTLRRSRPRKTFTAAILVALTGSASKTATALTAADALGKVVKATAAGAGAGAAGGILGTLFGFLGAFWGIREDYRRAETPQEKRLIRWGSGLLLAYVALLAALLAATPRLVGWRGLSWWDLIGGWCGLLIGGICWWGSWYNRKRRDLRLTAKGKSPSPSEALVLVERDWRRSGPASSSAAPFRTTLMIVVLIAVFAALLFGWFCVEFGLVDLGFLQSARRGKPLHPVATAAALGTLALVILGSIVSSRRTTGYRKLQAAGGVGLGAYVIGHLWIVFTTDLPSRWGAGYSVLYGLGLGALIIYFARKLNALRERTVEPETERTDPATAACPVSWIRRDRAYRGFYLMFAGSVAWMVIPILMTKDWATLAAVSAAVLLIPWAMARVAAPSYWRIVFTELVAIAALTLAVVNLRWTAWMELYRQTPFYQPINDLPLWVVDLVLAAVFAFLLIWIARRSRRQQRLLGRLLEEGSSDDVETMDGVGTGVGRSPGDRL